MNTKKIVWQSSRMHTTELLKFETGKDNRVSSLIIGEVEEKPIQVSYQLVIDINWHIRSVSMQVETDHEFKFYLEKKQHQWHDQTGLHHPELDHATDIDISLTPFTNTLPIRRLRLQNGHTEEIKVVYFDLPSGKLKPMKQFYTNMGAGAYKYESPGFTTIIATDSEGFVTDYPDIWKMVFPKLS